MNATDVLPWLETRTRHWWARCLEEFPRPEGLVLEPPEIQFFARNNRWLGFGGPNFVRFNLVHALLHGKEFDGVVRHEVAHCFAERWRWATNKVLHAATLTPRSGPLHLRKVGHGSLWAYIDGSLGGDMRPSSGMLTNGDTLTMRLRCLRLGRALLALRDAERE